MHAKPDLSQYEYARYIWNPHIMDIHCKLGFYFLLCMNYVALTLSTLGNIISLAVPLQHCSCSVVPVTLSLQYYPEQYYPCNTASVTMPLLHCLCNITPATLSQQYFCCNIVSARLSLQHCLCNIIHPSYVRNLCKF